MSPPALLAKQVGVTSTTVTYGVLIANVFMIGGYLVVGLIGQRIGRRTTMMSMGGLIAVVGSSAYAYMVSTASIANVFQTMALATVAIVLGVSGWGLLSAYVNECFKANVRASGFRIIYSLAVMLPSFYGFFLPRLAIFMPYLHT